MKNYKIILLHPVSNDLDLVLDKRLSELLHKILQRTIFYLHTKHGRPPIL